MGMSDTHIFPVYQDMLKGVKYDSVALLGFLGETDFTRSLHGQRDFYDIQFKDNRHWDINAPWTLPKKYDLVVCTRCPLFAKDPNDFIERCKQHLNPGGKILVSWELGDNFRSDRVQFSFKVGFVRDGQHEWCYFPENRAYSCMWRKEFVHQPDVQKFWSAVLSNSAFGYSEKDDLDHVVREEVPTIVDYDFEKIAFKYINVVKPALNIVTLL